MSDPDDPHNENKNQETEVTTADVMEMVGITPEKLLKNYNKDIKKTYIKKRVMEQLKEKYELSMTTSHNSV